MQTGLFISLLGIMFVSLLIALRMLRNWQKRRLVEAGFSPDRHLALGLFGVAIDFQRSALAYFKVGKIFIVDGASIAPPDIVPEHREASLFNPAPPKLWLNIFTLDPNIPVIRIPFSSEKEALQWRIYLHNIRECSIKNGPYDAHFMENEPNQAAEFNLDIDFTQAEADAEASGMTKTLIEGFKGLNPSGKKAAIVQDMHRVISNERKLGIKIFNQSAIARYLKATIFPHKSVKTLRGWVQDAM